MSEPVSPKACELRKLLTGAQLPALPQSAIKLLELSQNADIGPPEFAKPIEADPGLTGQVLRFVNSSYFGFAREISSVKLAISLVGIRTIKNFSLWSAVFSLMPNPKCGPFDLKSLWQDSLRRALFARNFGKLMGLKEAEDAFAGALLQDMAVPLLAKELPADYTALLAQRDGGKRRLSELEQERFGWTHADAAAQMARNWNLPREFADLVERHTQFDQATLEQGLPPLQAAVTLSSLLPASSDAAWTDAANFDGAFHAWCPGSPQSIAELLAQVDGEFTEFAPVLKLATPAKSLEQSHQEAIAPV
jgi:HD-like signal output (HDOD) protein